MAELINRETALDARPVRRAALETARDADGALRLAFDFARPSWQCRLGAPAKARRTFVLDELGAEVYELCDGKNSVGSIAEMFAVRHKVSLGEAEHSVSEYLKTMLKKGIIMMEVDRVK
jgi:hypothetical protein